MNKNIAKLRSMGQSIWYDNLSRDLLLNGELKKIVDEGVSGLTSNPTIFQKAISGSDVYKKDLTELKAKGLSKEAIIKELMVNDIRSASDLLYAVYQQEEGRDGYVSIEVSPELAYDTDATVSEAEALWSTINKENLMIKVPATKQGIKAIEELIYRGVNVNVTLIFSVARYQEVIDAYLKGLEKRKEEGLQPKVASVASFFVSRVDALCEKELQRLIDEGAVSREDASQIIGKVGIANSRLAYAAFQKSFSSERFRALESSGAYVQRPLWASTGPKNPSFDPLIYVKGLVAKDTVNTLPPKVLNELLRFEGSFDASFMDKLEEANSVIEKVRELGLNLEDMLLKLEEDGVKAFSESYRELVSVV